MGRAREDDERWMARACAQARLGLGRTSPNPAVGCVIVKNGVVVGEGFHRRAGLAHAEIEALGAAGSRARGATAYVTLEPCCHQGRTGPCTNALVRAGIARVVMGCKDPNPAVAGKGARALARAAVETAIGTCSEECADLIRGFRQWIVHGRPWVELKLAASLDGRIAARGGASKWLSSPPSRQIVQSMRARADAVLVGVGTVLADDPRLTCRLPGAAQPLRVVLDRRLRTPPSARVVRGRGRCLIVCAPDAPPVRRRRLEAAGAQLADLRATGRAEWPALLRLLGKRNVLELLIEGGSQVATSAIQAGVVNAVTLFYTPKVIGSDGIPLLGPLGVRHPSRAPMLESVSVERSGPDVVWRGVFAQP